MKEKVVLAYSGGLDTTALIPVLPNYISRISSMSSAMTSSCRV